MGEQHRDRQHGRRRVGLALAGDVGRRTVHRLEHRGGAAVGVDVAGRREPDTTGDGGGEVGDDVAEQIVGDDDVEPGRVLHQVDHRCIDMGVVVGDVGELGTDLLDRAAPHVPGVRQHVVLVQQGQLLALTSLRPRERIAHDALSAETGVDAHLGGQFVGCADAQGAAVTGVRTFRALADDDEVDALRRNGIHVQRTLDAGEQLGRTQVDVVVQFEADAQQQLAFEHSTRHARVADGTEQERVVAAQFLQHGIRQRLPRRVPAARTQVVLGAGHLGIADRVEHLETFGHDLRADAVPADDGQVDGVRSGVPAARLTHARMLDRRLAWWYACLIFR